MTCNNETNVLLGNNDQTYELCTGSNTSAIITIYNCFACSLPICDQFVFKVNDNHFHSLCLSCSECHIKLLDRCYARNGNVYCKEDFFKKFGTKCASCGKGIPPSEVVRRTNDYVYHLRCFSCRVCHRQLNTGDEFYLFDDRKLVCKIDYDVLKFKEHDDTSKRPRTTIAQKQLEILKQAYNESSKPARHMRESLATKTGLDIRVVQVWFQNRRAKEKRLKKDSNQRWQNAMRSRETNSRKGGKRVRIRKNRNRQYKDDLSDEDSIAVSHDKLSERDSDDSLSRICHTNLIYSDTRSRELHLSSTELSLDSSYT